MIIIIFQGFRFFPFGYGLSYTTFAVFRSSLSPSHTTASKDVEVSFTLKNTGTVGGDEVCQLYIKDELASVARPVLELKGFQRIYLKPGETKNVVFKISPDLLKMFNKEMQEVIEPGDFRIMSWRFLTGHSSSWYIDSRVVSNFSVSSFY